MDLGASSGGLPPDAVVESRDEILAATQAAIEEFHDPSPDSMLRIGVAPCSPFSVTGALMAEAAELARRAGVRMHTHLAETADETQYCAERFGCTPVQYVESLGWLGDDVWLAHGVHLDDAAIASLAATGTGVAHCPSSNGRLGAGVCRVPDLLAAGVPVGLGVDGAASQEASSLVSEIRQAALTARAAGGPRALSVRQALELATIGGASLLGWQDQIGSVEPGKLADIAVWRLDRLPHAGIADPVAALVLGSPPPLELLLVNGRPVVEHDRLVTVDEDAAAAAAQAVSARPGRPGASRAREGRAMSTPPRVPAQAPPVTRREVTPGGVGASPLRPDGTLKVTGQFAYGSDLWADDMIWGVTLRSPHPYARITGLDIGPALATAGVHAVLTHEDVPGLNRFGLEHSDQPVLADDVVRYQGEPVALVAADHPEIARRAAAKIRVGYDVLTPVTDAVAALADDAPRLHPDGNLVRHLKLRKGAPNPAADVVVTGSYRVGMQDQAFLGPEAGMAVPGEDGGVDLYVATQWLHVDQRQICAALGLPPEQVRLTLAGVGGAFGGREDLSMHVHACLLALHTGKPVKMMYNREESFFGHVHRHPATMRFEHGATRDGRLVYVRAEIWLDGGAYASSTPAVVGNAGTMGIGPYIVPNVHVDTYGVYTNNPPCGAMRGFGSVQTAFAYEAQMDKLAAVLGLDPVELRCRNAMELGCEAPTGQIVDSAAPVAELLRTVRDMPLPPASTVLASTGRPAG